LKGRDSWNKGLTKEISVGLKRLSESKIGKKLPLTVVKKMKISIKKYYENGGVIWNKGIQYDDIIKEKISEGVKLLWQSDEYVKKQMKSRNVMPNKAEMYLQSILNSIFFENQFQYVGDGKEIIGGKCPDFIDLINNKIIELYGDYWHRGQNPQDRIDYFKQFGYDTLVIWESELKDIEVLKNKLTSFMGG